MKTLIAFLFGLCLTTCISAQKGQATLGLDLSSTFSIGDESVTDGAVDGVTWHGSLLGGIYLTERIYLQTGGRYKYTEYVKQVTQGKQLLQQTDLEIPLMASFYMVDPETAFRPYALTGIGWTAHINEKWVHRSFTSDSLMSESFGTDGGFGSGDFDWTAYLGIGGAYIFNDDHEFRMLVYVSTEFGRAFRGGLDFEYNFRFPQKKKR